MSNDNKNGRSNDTVSDEEWARILGEPLDDLSAAGDGSQNDENNKTEATNGTESAGDTEPYKVGYKNPPKENQIKKGEIKNPKGRPKRKTEVESKNDMRALFWRAAMTPITTTVGGKRKKMPALEAVYLKLFARGMDDHMPSIRFIHTLADQMMTEHEDWQVTFYSHVLGLIEELKSQPDDEKNSETLELINVLMKRLDKKITD